MEYSAPIIKLQSVTKDLEIYVSEDEYVEGGVRRFCVEPGIDVVFTDFGFQDEIVNETLQNIRVEIS